jgi:hypothetical protein
LENRRIMDILHGIETKALGLRETQPTGEIMSIAATAADIELPMERPLHRPVIKPVIADIELETGDAEVDASALYSQVVVDKARLARHVRNALQERSQVTLRELIDAQPLQRGLAELVAYLELGRAPLKVVVDEASPEVITWQAVGRDGAGCTRRARMPRVTFVR